MANATAFIVEISGLSKRFPGVQALNNAWIKIRPGEIHGLVGENGAGKSTLIKILAGAQLRDNGTILVDGQPVELLSEREASRLELHFIHQDAALVERLSVAENLFLGKISPDAACASTGPPSPKSPVESLRILSTLIRPRP